MTNPTSEPLIYTENLSDISIMRVNVLYSLMLIRISRGYTSEDVSYLMGFEENIIEEMEEFNRNIDLSDVYRFVEAMEENSMKGILFTNFGISNSESNYKLVKVVHDEFIEISLFRDTDSAHNVFKLYEPNPDFIQDQESHNETILELRGILNIMFQGHFFDEPQTPFAIYRHCRSFCGSDLYPRQLKMVLNGMLKEKGKPKLVCHKSKTRGTISYEKIIK